MSLTLLKIFSLEKLSYLNYPKQLQENKWSLITSLIILFFFLLQDQNRLQPWVYIYILILIPYCISNHFKNLEIDLLIPIKIILIATYFWSGIQKANVNFIEGVFVHILMDLFKIQSIETIRSVLPLGYIISFTEIFIAFSLMFKKLRNIGIALAICTHTFILLYTSPLGLNNNYIIYPWNVAMILLVITLFYKDNSNFKVFKLISIKTTFLNYFYFVLLGLLPILNFFEKWDDYLSFSLYSEKSKIFYIAVSDKYIGLLNHEFDDCFLKLDTNIQGGKVIDVNKWSMKELNVPIYPEIRVFKKISKDFCKYGIPDTDIVFLMYKGTVNNDNLTKWVCKNLD